MALSIIFTTCTRNGFKKLQCERTFILCETSFRSNHQEVFYVKGVLRNFGFISFIKKEALAQEFFCEFCEISKNTFFCNLVLKKDKCLSVENILVKVWQSHFREIIELITSILRNSLIKRLFNFHAVFSNSDRK